VNFVDDVFILTNHRVIQIERKFIFFFETREETQYKNIRDTKVRINNLLENLFDIGTIILETPGNNPDIKITPVDHPFFLLDRINTIRSFAEKVKEKRDKNNRIEELAVWFSQTYAVMEKKMSNRGVPDLRGKDYFSAAALAAESGMKIVPIGEVETSAEMESGLIVSQNPYPGLVMERDGATSPQIEVMLSKQT
jgi:hypothetical protein